MGVALILSVNLGLTVLCLYSAWKLRQIRLLLQDLNAALTRIQYHCYRNLHISPPSTSAGRRGTQELRHNYQHLEAALLRLQRVQTILQLLQQLGLSSRRWW
ncbi:MAG: hypothetical protein ACO4CG_06685 [Prochlorothrix sp.]|nr:hypothetical protein [Prochlorothrix sp.]